MGLRMLKKPETFADQVDDYLHRVLNDKPLEPSYPHQVEQLGSALALIWSLINQHLRTFPLDPKGPAALRIFDELRSGRGNLIWLYIDAVKKARREANRPPPSELAEGLRMALVAAVRVYADIEHLKWRQARLRVVERAQLGDFGITADMIKNWDRKKDGLVDHFAADLKRRGQDPERLIQWIYGFVATQLRPAS